MASETNSEPSSESSKKKSESSKQRGSDTRELSADEQQAGQREGRVGAPARQETPLTQQIGRIAIGIIAVLFGVFAVANVQSVEFDWLFGSSEPPLILLLIASFVLGALVGWFATWRGGRHGPGRGDQSG